MKRQKQKLISGCVLPQRRCRRKTVEATKKPVMDQQTTLEQEILHLTNNDTFFPEMVWKIVSGKLRSSFEIENFSNSSSFLNKLLSNKRETKVVLPKVFEILAEKYAKSEDTSYKETNTHSITWNRLNSQPIHKMTGLWKCRLVCKTWCKAIDDLHQQLDVGHNFNMCTETQTSEPKNAHLLRYAKYAFSKRKIDQFLKHFSSTHYNIANKIVTKNPFLGRSIVFQLIPTRTSTVHVEYRNGIGEILEKWGGEIWYCTINHLRFGSRNDDVMFYRSFRQTLVLMPNLRTLHILYDLVSRNTVIPDYKALKCEICENPFPLSTLSNLANLSAVNLPGPILDHFVFVNSIPDGNICVRNDTW